MDIPAPQPLMKGKRLSAGEALGAALALAVGAWLLALRIRGGGLPTGDEGSWIAVAAELADGKGFTTRWLEAPFLVPYAIPRPDDFRYPFLVSLLALDFRIFGASVETARWTVAALQLAFATAAWGVCRAAFGRWAALACLWIMVTSLLQLEWGAAAYTESLFGLVVAGVAAWSLRGERSLESAGPFGFRSPGWWAVFGAALGLLYLVRVNGILMLPGVLWLYFARRRAPLTLRHPLAAFGAFALVISPWLVRTALTFGQPFHIAGSGGLLRDPTRPETQSHTLGILDYFSQFDPWFPLERLAVGAVNFLRDLHRYEHGLEVAPLLLASAALALRRPFLGPGLLPGFLLMGAASCYAAYNSWAGVRYMSGLLPFVYAYGLSALPYLAGRLAGRLPGGPRARRMLPIAGGLAIALLLLPVIQPHRFYQRKFSAAAAAGPYPYRAPLADHLARLARLVPPDGRYYAASLCSVNFLAPGRGCVGLQELYDPAWFARSREAFRPGIVALTHGETGSPALQAALRRMREEGYAQDTLEAGTLGIYLSLRPDTAAAGPLP